MKINENKEIKSDIKVKGILRYTPSPPDEDFHYFKNFACQDFWMSLPPSLSKTMLRGCN